MTPPPMTSPATGDAELGVFDVLDLMTGYQGAAALTAAARLGVFDALLAGPRDAAEVAEEIGTDPSATLALLDSLVGLRLLVRAGDGYATTPAGRRLTRTGDLRLIAEKEAFFARVWLDLADSVRTGTPRIPTWAQRLADDPGQCLFFLRALVVLAAETGPDLTRLLRPGDRVADLGGGLGAYATRLAAAGATVTLADLPQVCAWAESELAAGGLAAEVRERITLLPVDLLAEGAAQALGEHDVVLLSHLLHDLTDPDCARVLALAARVVRPGGRVVVFELPGDPPGAFGPMFDLMMRVETPGRARRVAELEALLRAAGLVDVALDPSYPLPHGVVVGTRA